MTKGENYKKANVENLLDEAGLCELKWARETDILTRAAAFYRFVAERLEDAGHEKEAYDVYNEYWERDRKGLFRDPGAKWMLFNIKTLGKGY